MKQEKQSMLKYKNPDKKREYARKYRKQRVSEGKREVDMDNYRKYQREYHRKYYHEKKKQKQVQMIIEKEEFVTYEDYEKRTYKQR